MMTPQLPDDARQTANASRRRILPWEQDSTAESPQLTAALEAAANGWHVFPLVPGGKVPALKANWREIATTDPATIRAWWTATPAANIGIATGAVSGISVVDVDVKGGRPGEDSAQRLGLPLLDTHTIRTASGGYHYYFRHVDGFRNRAGMMPGIDTRGDGGYVVGEGSIVDGEAYELANVGDVQPMPDSVLRIAGTREPAAGEPKPDPQAFDVDADEIRRIRAALGYLDPQPFETWVSVGMALHELAGGSEQMFELWNHWSAGAANYDRAIMRKRWQGFASDRPDKITEATLWHMAREAGYVEPAIDLQYVPETTVDTITHSELLQREFEPAQWAINDLLPIGVAMLAAKPKIGKSWLALQMCGTKAGGRALWHGRELESPGGALYISLEDNLRRLQARSLQSFPWEINNDPGGPIASVKGLPDLHFATEWPRIGNGGLRQLRAWLEIHPSCRLVVIDTWARIREKTTGKSAYNEDYRLGEFLKPIADRYGVAILVIHHTRKMEAEDPLDLISGTQGVAGSVDTVLVLSRIRGSGDAQLFVTGRDIEEQPDLALRFDRESCTWRSTGISVAEAKLDKGRQEILAVVRRSGAPLTIKQIRAGLTEDGITKSLDAVSKAVGRMVTAHELEKVDSNKYEIGGGMHR